ncbi:MAG TPA: redox-sensing transcriptional repressor Rex [Bellilinea sp.]|nr:redox-sensing transcriptional repressor Rex [Bellilinea sp.]
MINPCVPDIIVSRLPIYLRTLELLSAEGIRTTSSQLLAEKLGISAAQIRKDLSQFGEFGKQGTGYSVNHLIEQLRSILHLTHPWELILIGAGDLGSALARYQGFSNRGFKVAAAYDSDKEKVGKKIGKIEIRSTDQLEADIKKHGYKIAMLSIPASEAQHVTDQLVAAGIKAILSYAPVNLRTPEDVRVSYLDPLSQLQHLTYYLDSK